MLTPEVVAAVLIAALSFAFELIPGLVDLGTCSKRNGSRSYFLC